MPRAIVNSVQPSTELVVSATELAHQLIHALRARDPTHSTFSQVGLLDGRDVVLDYIRHGELGCALHHLLYMVHESAIDFPRVRVLALHQLAEELGEPSGYSRKKVAGLAPEHREHVYNAP